MALPPVAIPYGLRQVQLTGYTDFTATILNASSVWLPYSQTLSFKDTEDFEELRGDDKLVTTHGKGPIVEWELTSGGISLDAYKLIAGGAVTTSGVTPNLQKKYRKLETDIRPWFKAEGRAISDSGGDFHTVIWRCRANDDLEGEFNDGDFFTPGGKGLGLGCLIVGPDLGVVYDFLQNESPVTIP